jgi:WD40 repeat protein/tetratricopeptide (TPR) repeat protein
MVLAFLGDGRLLLSAGFEGTAQDASAGRTARLWRPGRQPTAGRPLAPDFGREVVVPRPPLAFSPDGKLLLTGAADRRARLWQAATGRPAGKSFDYDWYYGGLAFNPDGRRVLAGRNRLIRTFDVESGRQVEPTFTLKTSMVGPLAMSPDQRRVVAGDAGYGGTVLDAATGRLVADLAKDLGQIRSIAFSRDGTRLFTGDNGGGAWLREPASGKPLVRLPHEGPVAAAAFSPDGRTLLTATTNGGVFRWDAATGKLLGRPLQSTSWFEAMALSPDGSLLATGDSHGTIRLWNVAAGRTVFQPLAVARQAVRLNAPNPALQVVFSPDGKGLAVASEAQVRLFDLPGEVRGSVERVRLWIEVSTGKELDAEGALRVLGPDEWHARRRRLRELGGPPEVSAAGPAPPPLTRPRPPGPQMLSRGSAWDDWHREQTVAEQTRTLRQKPNDVEALLDRGSASCALGRWDEAVADFRKVTEISSDTEEGWWRLATALLAKEDREGFRQTCRRMIDRFDAKPDVKLSWTGLRRAMICTLMPGAGGDDPRLLRLAEEGMKGTGPFRREALAGVLVRAGKYEEAIKRLPEAEQVESLVVWYFLAMAHHRLGHAGEARTWLGKVRRWCEENLPPSAAAGKGMLPVPGTWGGLVHRERGEALPHPYTWEVWVQRLRREVEELVGKVS